MSQSEIPLEASAPSFVLANPRTSSKVTTNASGSEVVHRIRPSSATSSLSSLTISEAAKSPHNFITTTFTTPTFLLFMLFFRLGCCKTGTLLLGMWL